MCHAVLDPLPSAGGLWRRGVSHGIGPTSRQGSALVSSCVPRFQTRLLVREGSSIATYHMALDVLWATSKKEILSRSTYSVGPTYLRGMPVHS
jgi:hypothetical protein